MFILKPELMPHPKATADWEVTQEYNIMYVAWTRHKKALYFVGGLPLFEVPDPDRDDEKLVLDSEDLEDLTSLPSEPTPHLTDRPAFTDGSFDDGFNDRWLEHKAEFARREAEQERAAFASDPDYRRSLLDEVTGAVKRAIAEAKAQATGNILAMFPPTGRFEDNIYRPSAWEMAAAMPDWTPTVENGQLVLVKELAEGHRVKCWTSIRVGEIAGGTGEDSIRVVREDQGRDGKVWRFKNDQDWVTRQVPKDADTPEKAAAHLAAKVEAQVAQMMRPCPECGQVQVKCRAGKGRDARLWWKGTGDCRCRVEGGW